ncbi:uncharacterized protein A4U43_C05F24040 [Asparagus officinalis]|uniref:SCP domain-containing protein n=1 Tax=Asparagus officinalis TaxID=4686 RepID=A0A5P1EYC9_ASPOF|nr:pathogenesis-related protein PR-1-like [Asparagus officinalis]ONK69539.1 uncharacterized protein A4U43_C05F24040 [Asparagus officinalis]
MASSSSLLLLLLTTLSISSIFSLKITNDILHPQQVDPRATVYQLIAAHNIARKAVGVPPLVWDTKLAYYAKLYANQRRHDCQLIHSPGYIYGENIFWGKGRKWSATDVVASWVGEKKWYHYDTNTCSGQDCSHYTQIVWRTTEKLGCAKIKCDSGDIFVVCEYYPPGNYVGARPY